MKPESRFRVDILAGTTLCVVCVVISALTIQYDAGAAGSKFSENSATEKMQLVYLFSTTSAFGLTAWRKEEWRGMATLMAGGTLVMTIREMDGVFDQIRHGAWFPVAVATGLITCGLAGRWRMQLQDHLDEFLHMPAFGAFLSACLCLFIFSRLFGMKEVWESLFEVQELEPMQRWVKNAVEEGSELFGYTLLFLSSYGFSRYTAQFAGAKFIYRQTAEKPGLAGERVHAS
ncbi:hypothetical protein [Pontiella agarivorans]|uniref:Uncharacterized protein n=1 Tax=Pontiella agarivorans TaxID=3038953 RepID=A0ABU5MXA3_9BACT|nr:hypothetical protein [Pontiella agarivorans]MDZ8118807.1 hypothetical protein [Pontiella agarivorans]